MKEHIVYSVAADLFVLENGKRMAFPSLFYRNYIQNHIAVKDRRDWKHQGQGAMFRMDLNPHGEFDPRNVQAYVNGLAMTGNGMQALYSLSVMDTSGLFFRNLDAGEDTEDHIVHDTDTVFGNLDYCKRTGRVVMALQKGAWEQHIAVKIIEDPHYRLLTEGDSVDANPSWSKTDTDLIFYDTAGIGRDGQGAYSGVGESSVCSLNLRTGDLQELVAQQGHHCTQPKEDDSGNLYFIKKPVMDKGGKGNPIVDTLLIPGKISVALFNWVEHFTMRYSGMPLRSGGANPAKARQESVQDMFIRGNLIRAAETLKENEKHGEKNPGIAPRNWELMCMDRSGSLRTVKKGVLDYDLSRDGSCVYSNGRHIVKLELNGSEHRLADAELAENIRILAV